MAKTKNNEITYQVTINPENVSSKPGAEESKYITRKLTTVTGWTINDFSTYVSPPYSYTWSGGIFDGTRSNATWTEQWVFALDFDDTISIEKALSKCKEFGLSPQIYYKTFGYDTTVSKFRLVFFLEKPVVYKVLHEFILLSLLELFPEADQACKDRGRYFFGGKESSILSQTPIPINQFIGALSINTYSGDSNSFRKVPLDLEYFKNLQHAQSGENLYNIYRDSHNPARDQKTKNTSIRRGLVEKFDFDLARQKIKILDEFLKGKWLTHTELFGLATNLIHIKGGRKLMTNTMNKYNDEGKTRYTDNNFNILPYVRKVEYFPQPIYKFSPYSEDEELLDMVTSTKEVRGQIEIIEPPIKMKLDEAEESLQRTFQEVTQGGKVGDIYIIKVPTSIGKTRLLEDVNATIALPTNSLKNEMAHRMKVKYEMTPDPVIFETEWVNQKISNYHKIGLSKKSMEVLYHIVLPANSKKFPEGDVQQAREYIDLLTKSFVSTSTLLTTHKRALFSEFSHDTLIFDEDPLNSILEIKELKISDVFTANLLTKFEGVEHILTYLQDVSQLEIRKTPTFSVDIDTLIEKISMSKLSSNLIDFLSSSFFVRDGQDPDLVYYIVKQDLPRTKKIVILSATVPTEIYKTLFGDRVHIYDITDVQQMGSVIQHTSRSCSRHGLNSYVTKISEKVGDKPVITFKSFDRHFNNPVEDMYFGNCSGYDSLKGRDIAVVGTPHRNNVKYFLTAKVLGVNFKTTDTTMLFQKIEHNGFRFKFNCFENDDLREIQLSLIESDLIQAVGRARTLRTSATVDLYSNFPLRISDEFLC